ncbi:hypothetical protein [Peribacillus acanthi]|uniref:hypothetical protein n=1 Tax=Peribacillus acanthi TaxID=2171554 RepID=UPI000D3E4136|nr:hypothetical protein [Peribacillus acanthi]
MDEKRLDRMEEMLTNLITMVSDIRSELAEFRKEMKDFKEDMVQFNYEFKNIGLKKDTLDSADEKYSLRKQTGKNFDDFTNVLTEMRGVQELTWEKAIRNEREIAKLN